MIKRVLIRADAHSRVGYGHLMRSIALAQALSREGVAVSFCTATSEDSLCRYLQAQAFPTHFLTLSEKELGSDRDLEQMQKWIASPPDWVVLDNEYFATSYQTLVRETGARLLVLDDHNRRDFDADLIVNHSLHAETLGYKKGGGCRRLLGPRYALIRQELLDFPQTENKCLRHVLVTLGGSPQEEMYKKILTALSQIKTHELQIRLLAGSSQRSVIQSLTAKFHSHEIELCETSFDLASLYDWAGLAVCAAGGTCLELCFFGVTGLVGALESCQLPVTESLATAGIFQSIGDYRAAKPDDLAHAISLLLKSPSEENVRCTKIGRLIDGGGANRILDVIKMITNDIL